MGSVHEFDINVDMNQLSECSVVRPDGTHCMIKTLWEKSPAILVFLRHFACGACRQHALDVWNNRAAYEVHGATIHFIGNGELNHMIEFQKLHGLEKASFFTDTSLKVFNAAGFRRGFWIDPGEMHTRSEFLWLAVRYQMRKTGSGNIWQLGGVLAVCPGGKATYQFTSQTMGHFPPINDIPKMTKKPQ